MGSETTRGGQRDHSLSLISSDRVSVKPGSFSSSCDSPLFSEPPPSNAVFCDSKFDPWFLHQESQCSSALRGTKARDVLGPNGSDEDDESSDGAKENALHRRIVRHDCGLPILYDRCSHVLPAYRLNLCGC
jgi:hypothetical protein